MAWLCEKFWERLIGRKTEVEWAPVEVSQGNSY